MKNVINIKFSGNDLEKKLSNMYQYDFSLDGIKFSSFEGFLQSLKTPIPSEKRKIWKMYGFHAWKYGQQFDWTIDQKLYWKEQVIMRDSVEYTKLIERAYDRLLKNVEYKHNLLESLGSTLDHTVGKSDKTKSLLTKTEYIYNLNRLRDKIKPNRFHSLFGV